MQALLVRDLMTTSVRTIRPYTRLSMIKQIMCEYGVHRLPVVENERLLGIITLGDVRNAFPSDLPTLTAQPRPRLDVVRADQLMRTEVITIAPEAAVTTAMELLIRHKISGLPVITDERLVGIITKSDVCRAVIDGTLVAATHARHTSHADREMFPYPMSALAATVGATTP